MSDEARKAKNDYQRKYLKEWRKKNPDKSKEYQNRYWEKKFTEATKENKEA